MSTSPLSLRRELCDRARAPTMRATRRLTHLGQGAWRGAAVITPARSTSHEIVIVWPAPAASPAALPPALDGHRATRHGDSGARGDSDPDLQDQRCPAPAEARHW